MEKELSSKVLNKSAQIRKNMIKKNKRKLVKTYGKEAERVVVGKAINAAKKAVEMEENTHKTRIKELVRKSLMQEDTLEEKAKFSKEFDNNPALKGGQKKLPDALQKSIIKKAKGELKEFLAPEDLVRSLQKQGVKIDLQEPYNYKDIKDALKALGLAGKYDDLMPQNYSVEWPEYPKDMYTEDIDLGHEDNEPHYIKSELYKIGKYSMILYSIMEELEERGGEIDLPAWWQSKITAAKTMISSAKHYLEFELAEPKVDAFVDRITGEEPHEGEPPVMEEKKKADDKEGLRYALATNLAKYGRPQSKSSDKPSKLTKSLEKGREKHVKKLKKYIKEEELVDKVSEGFLDRLKAQAQGAGAFVGTGLGNLGRSFMGKDLKNPKLEAGMAKLGQKAKTLEKELTDVVNDINKLFPQTSLSNAPKELQQTIDAYKRLLNQTSQANSAIAAGKVFAQEKPTPQEAPKSGPARDEKGRFTSTKTSTSPSTTTPINANYEVTSDTYTYKGKNYPVQIDKKTKEKFFKHEDGRIMDIASIEKFAQDKKKAGSIAEKLAKKLKSE